MQINFSELGKYYFDIANIFVVKQTACGKTKFIMQEPRSTDGLLFFANTTGIYYQKNSQPIIVPQGAVVYLPKNSNYMCENSPALRNGCQEQILFEFTLSNADIHIGNSIKKELSRLSLSDTPISFGDKVMVVTTQHSVMYRQLFTSLLTAFSSPNVSPLAVYSAAYELFNAISSNSKLRADNVTDTKIIRESIKYLENNEKISITEIAGICNISVGHYERLFRYCTGMSPGEYRNIQKINRVKMYLQKGEYNLDIIAEKMGWCDSGYLCRIFKKRTGMTPGEYRKIYISQTQKIICSE